MSPGVVERVMAITRADFLRLLPRVAAADTQIDIAALGIEVIERGLPIRISLREEADVVIASLRLPRLRVQIELPADAAVGQDFMRRFDRAFQRGGG